MITSAEIINQNGVEIIPYLVEQILLRHEVFLEHVLVEVVGRADAPLHTAAGHLNRRCAHERMGKKRVD